ncbi:MAG: single-stranded DNA-binding protein [Pseudomonadales bacterium]|nr:single-stranded DNA-binding protein [Candidatus Woesebacteria bacterium]MCB9801998.1 single-stranded DNA-binding protein [Pseudomonadales bacterium]
MASRSLNKVQLIGNLTRDPELRYIPSGAAVCSFGLATNRSWTSDSGEKQESVEFHNITAWRKLAEICDQLLGKGDKVYIEGRLQTRSWTGEDGNERKTTDIVAENMILLRSIKGADGEYESTGDKKSAPSAKSKSGSKSQDDPEPKEEASAVEDISDDIPF